MNDYESSDEEQYYEDSGQTPTFFNSFDSIRTRKRVEIGLYKGYCPEWTCVEAFREVYQNWRDSIIRTNHSKLHQFSPNYSEKVGRIEFKQYYPNTEQLLGYILFRYRKDGFGQLEVTNFGASLEYRHLKLGDTTKASDDDQTGNHGEGFKVAALIFRRHSNNHNFRIVSSGVSCNFRFTQSLDMVCTISRLSEAKRDAARKKVETPPGLTSDPCKDVSVYIGELRKGISSEGRNTKGSKIHVNKLRQWLEVVFDLNPPEAVVRTACGDLILDPSYRENFYLKGLLLPRGSRTSLPYKYGYNFNNGQTTRDRDSLSAPGEETRNVCKIWTSAILSADPKSSELLVAYTNLLLVSPNNWGDVDGLLNYQPWLSAQLVQKVWAHMCTINVNGDGRTAFYYTASTGNDLPHEAHMIQHSLKRHPVVISTKLWKMFRHFKLPRTAEEEQHHRFSRAKVIEIPNRMFAMNMEWMLRCCIRSYFDGKEAGLEFVDGKDLSIDAAYFESGWKFHDKWLTHVGTQHDSFCKQSRPEEEDAFCCDHTVLELWNYMTSQTTATDKSALSAKESNKSKIRMSISQMPRGIKCFPTQKKGELEVKWVSVDAYQNLHELLLVVLHYMGCSKEPPQSWYHPLNALFNREGGDQFCECPSQKVEVGSLSVIFTGLNPERQYFASVSRDLDGAFIGRPPAAVRPLQKDIVKVKQEPICSDVIVLDDSSDAEANEPLPGAGSTFGGLNNDVARSRSYPVQQPSDALPSTINDSLEWPPLPNQNSRMNVQMEEKGTYVLGQKIDHRALDWGGSFPGSHTFYRTQHQPEEDVFIVKPKEKQITDEVNDNGKRTRFSTSEPRPAKRIGAYNLGRNATVEDAGE